MPSSINCYICSKIITRNSSLITCSSCNKSSIHASCFSQSNVNNIPNGLKCSVCSSQSSPLNSTILHEINKIFEILEVTNSKLDALVEENKSFREKIDSLESRIAKLEAEPTALPDKMKLQDSISREKNIFFFNVPESNVNELNDNAVVSDIFSNIDVDIPFTKIIRLVKVGPKPQPLKVICKVKSDIGLILKSKSKLRNSPSMKNFHISLDQRAYQREQYKSLRSVLISRRNNGESNLVIGYTNDIPTIIKQSKN